jgi:hypothetical protein
MALREANTINDMDVNTYSTNDCQPVEFFHLNNIDNSQNLLVPPTHTLVQTSNQIFSPPDSIPDSLQVNNMDYGHNETHTSNHLLCNDYSNYFPDVGVNGNLHGRADNNYTSYPHPPQPVQTTLVPPYFNERANYRNPENIQSAGHHINSSSVSYFTIPMPVQANTGIINPGFIVMKVEYTTLAWLPGVNMGGAL